MFSRRIKYSLGPSGFVFLWGIWETVFLSFCLKMEELTKNWCNLLLSEKEQTSFIMPEDHRKGEFVIAAKFLTSRFLQMEVVARTFTQLW